MAKIINLKAARKSKARAAKEAQSVVNRAAFGRSKAERELEGARADKARRDLDSHKMDEP